MANIKEYDIKLNRLKNTQKMTRTMKLVSMSKLYKAHEAQKNAKTYANKLTDLISRLAVCVDPSSHPLLRKSSEIKNALILIMSSDKGLCGSFNNSLNRKIFSWYSQIKDKKLKIDISCCGKKGYIFLKKHFDVKFHYENVTGKPSFINAIKIGKDLSHSFQIHEYDEIYLVYNQFHSPLSQTATFEKILPIESKEVVTAEDNKFSSNYIFEPPMPELLFFLIPKYLYFRIYFALLENSAGEHGARMTAMDSASKNAADLIDRYTLLRNRARQSAITTELTEIISGAEALN